MWSAAIFVVALQVPVTVLLSRISRRSALGAGGVVLTVSYLGFLAATLLGSGGAAPAIAAVSVVCTIGEIIHARAAPPGPRLLGRVSDWPRLRPCSSRSLRSAGCALGQARRGDAAVRGRRDQGRGAGPKLS
ncbi:hypothetical protein [Amycolatopsis rubida]|uniref:hypothetical protein n=1 Tax=Amycolatopsis rubida TaxID=112413 RepID=UPI001AD7EDE5|nr:hypothetical protein [Amycolatopsis rubida]